MDAASLPTRCSGRGPQRPRNSPSASGRPETLAADENACCGRRRVAEPAARLHKQPEGAQSVHQIGSVARSSVLLLQQARHLARGFALPHDGEEIQLSGRQQRPALHEGRGQLHDRRRGKRFACRYAWRGHPVPSSLSSRARTVVRRGRLPLSDCLRDSVEFLHRIQHGHDVRERRVGLDAVNCVEDVAAPPGKDFTALQHLGPHLGRRPEGKVC